jgi:hypothetical protein
MQFSTKAHPSGILDRALGILGRIGSLIDLVRPLLAGH